MEPPEGGLLPPLLEGDEGLLEGDEGLLEPG